YVTGATSVGYAEDWDLDQLWTSLKQLYPVGITVEDVIERAGGDRTGLDADLLTKALVEDARAAYARREEELGSEAMREAERQILLNVIDRKWREHLYEMDYLKEGVGLRAYAQRNPVVEYQREGYAMFQTMLDGTKEEAVGFLLNVEVQARAARPAEGAARPAVPWPVGPAAGEVRARGLVSRPQPAALQYSAPTIDGAAGTGAVTVEREQDRTAAPALGLGRGPQVGAGPVVGRITARPAGAGAAGAGRATAPGRGAAGRGRPGPRPRPAGAGRQQAPGQVVGSTPARNAPCPCGSGKKYKHCHGAP